MTIAKTTSRAQYSGDGTTKAFTFPYRFFDDTDLEVYILSAAGIETIQTLTTDYSVANTGDENGGTVTMVTAPGATDTITILRNIPETQGTDYTANDAFPAETHEAALDRLTLLSQQLSEQQGRALTVSISDGSVADLPSKSDRKGKYLYFDPTSGDPSVSDMSIIVDDDLIFDTFAEMVSSVAVNPGNVAQTRGYTTALDGGGGFYKMITDPAAWVTATAYTAGAYTLEGGKVYVCATSHTSGTFATDMAAGKWVFVAIRGDAGSGVVLIGGTGMLAIGMFPGNHVHAEQFGLTLDGSGEVQEKSAAFNAAFAYAASIAATYSDDDALSTEVDPVGARFSCHTSFKAKDVLCLTDDGTVTGGKVEFMRIDWSGFVFATTGGTLATHTDTRPIPLVFQKLRFSKVTWPELYPERICAGIKAKVDTGNVHRNLRLFEFMRYGLWKVANNDCVYKDCTIKQFIRDVDLVKNGVDTSDFSNWNADCIVSTTKDWRMEGIQVGWGGPCVRLLDSMPATSAEYIPGQNVYWCGLESGQGYVDGDNGAGDCVFNDMHMMQGLGDGSFIADGSGTRTGFYADYDFSTGGMIIREVDTPIGVLSFSKISNPSFFRNLDNDNCNHYLFGAQVEFSDELPGSANTPRCGLADEVSIIDPRIRVFASRGGVGAQRYPYMFAQHNQRNMTVGFEDDRNTFQTIITAGGLVDGQAFLADHQTGIETAGLTQKNIKYVSAVGLTDVGDGVHFDGAALVTLGERHAAAALSGLAEQDFAGPIVILGIGQSNLVGNTTATGGDHTISSGVYVWDQNLTNGSGTAFITAAFGTAPFARGSDPWANNLLIHMANDLKASTGRDVYIIVAGKGARNLESFITPATNTANSWTADEDLSSYMADAATALAAVPGRTSLAPDIIALQQGEANSADTPTVYSDKLLALTGDLQDHTLQLFHPSIAWKGQWGAWNSANYAHGRSDIDRLQYRGFLAAGTHSPTVAAAGDYWLLQGTVTINPGGVSGSDDQILYALTASPAGAGDWLVVDVDAAPARQATYFTTDIKAHQQVAFPGVYDAAFPQIGWTTGDDFFQHDFTVNGTKTSVMRGFGRPEGVITANKGSVYLDLTARYVWNKASGSGNTGWETADRMNARAFGAVGDGTTDDTVALQAWLDFIKSNNKPGFLPAGEYVITDELDAYHATLTNRLIIEGAGDRESVIVLNFLDAGKCGLNLHNNVASWTQARRDRQIRNIGFKIHADIAASAGHPKYMDLGALYNSVLENVRFNESNNTHITGTKLSNMLFNGVYSDRGGISLIYKDTTAVTCSGTSGTKTLTLDTAITTASDAGKWIRVNADEKYQIDTVDSTTQYTLIQNLSSTHSGVEIFFDGVTVSGTSGTSTLTLDAACAVAAHVGAVFHVANGKADGSQLRVTVTAVPTSSSFTIAETLDTNIVDEYIASPVFEFHDEGGTTNDVRFHDVDIIHYSGVGMSAMDAKRLNFSASKLHGDGSADLTEYSQGAFWFTKVDGFYEGIFGQGFYHPDSAVFFDQGSKDFRFGDLYCNAAVNHRVFNLHAFSGDGLVSVERFVNPDVSFAGSYLDANSSPRIFLSGISPNEKARVGSLSITNIPVYADNAAAVSGGLAVGDVYSTATGEVRIVV